MSSTASGDLQHEFAELLVAPAPEALEQGIYPEHRGPAAIEPRHYGRNLPGGYGMDPAKAFAWALLSLAAAAALGLLILIAGLALLFARAPRLAERPELAADAAVALANTSCQPTSKTAPLPTPKSEPPPSRFVASFPGWFRLGCAGGASACSWFS
jgi:hypothetical protein